MNTLFDFTKCTSAIVDRQETEFQLIGFGFVDCRREETETFRRIQPYHTLHFILSGKGHLQFRKQTYELTENDVFVMPDNIPFRYYPDETEPWSYAFFEFTGSMSAKYLEEAGFSLKECTQTCERPTQVREELRCFFNAMHENGAFSYQKILSLFFLILSHFTKPQKNVQPMQEDAFIQNVKNFINARCLEHDFSIEYVTDKFFISHSYLCKIFKQKTGETLIAYINEQKMLNAERLLKTTDLSAAEIAYLSGYACYPHFLTCFKKRHALTTRQYRELVKKQSKK